LKNCERLQSGLLHLLQRLQELVHSRHLSVIFISRVPFSKLPFHRPPVKILFPRYHKAQLTLLLSEQMKETQTGESEQLHRTFLETFLGTMYSKCRDLKQLRVMAGVLFPCYVEPVESGRLSPDDVTGLYRHVLPHMKRATHLSTGIAPSWTGKEEKDRDWQLAALELPYYGKYMLLASYLASYLPSKCDATLFLKQAAGRGRKRALKQSQSDDRCNAVNCVGPKPFGLSRLLAIFLALHDEPPPINVNLLSQMCSLVELNLVHCLSDGSLNKPSYKCSVNLLCVTQVAKSVKINLDTYLDYK